jgi:hypothetical protein
VVAHVVPAMMLGAGGGRQAFGKTSFAMVVFYRENLVELVLKISSVRMALVARSSGELWVNQIIKLLCPVI